MGQLWKIVKMKDDMWNNYVEEFNNSDVYLLKEYVKAFEIHGDGTPELFYFNNGITKALQVVMKRDIGELEIFKGRIERNCFFDFITPYGYGGFIIEGKEIELVMKAYSQYCKKSKVVSEFVRFHPIFNNKETMLSQYQCMYQGKTVSIDTRTENYIWGNMVSQNRNKIRKAQREGIKIYWTRSPWIIPGFMDLYQETMKKDSALDYYYFSKEFFESILEDLKYHALWFYADYQGKIIAAAIFLSHNRKMHYHLSCVKTEYQRLAPMNLLLYEAAVWASHNQIDLLHLGGGLGAKEDSLYAFKKSFNRNGDREFWIGRRIWDKDAYDKLTNIRKEADKMEKCNYFPEYRA